MEFVVFGIEAVQRSPAKAEIIEIAAVFMGKDGREAGSFECLVKPSEETLAGLGKDAIESSGISLDDLRSADTHENVAKRLRAFLEGYPKALLHAFNLGRAVKLLSQYPWEIRKGWGADIRDSLADLMEDQAEGGCKKPVKLYDAALLLNVPVPIRRRAISDARVSAGILGKMGRISDRMLDADFLKEAEYIMEDGL